MKSLIWSSLAGMSLLGSPAQALTAVDGKQLESIYAVDQLVLNGAKECVRFRIYLADESRQKARGLMFVAELPEDWGMLFRYPAPRRISMYMKNTLIPLDMLFFAANGSVVHVAANTTPGSLKSIAPNGPAIAVLEINAGLSERLGFKAGSKLLSKIL
jgi:uncharacterized membrane protein (UPF0127 family)